MELGCRGFTGLYWSSHEEANESCSWSSCQFGHLDIPSSELIYFPLVYWRILKSLLLRGISLSNPFTERLSAELKSFKPGAFSIFNISYISASMLFWSDDIFCTFPIMVYFYLQQAWLAAGSIGSNNVCFCHSFFL